MPAHGDGSASLLFALIANIVARRGVDNDHSFGHGRIEVLAAFVNGIAMLGVVLWLFFEAYQRFSDPPEVAGGSVMIVAVIGLVINVLVALSLSRDKKNVNTRSALVHVMGDLLDRSPPFCPGPSFISAAPGLRWRIRFCPFWWAYWCCMRRGASFGIRRGC